MLILPTTFTLGAPGSGVLRFSTTRTVGRPPWGARVDVAVRSAGLITLAFGGVECRESLEMRPVVIERAYCQESNDALERRPGEGFTALLASQQSLSTTPPWTRVPLAGTIRATGARLFATLGLSSTSSTN